MDDVKLVPARMLLDKETIGAINFHCGDGGDSFGKHSDGLLWIGTVTDDDGKEVYGLHLATAEYPEEGSTTLVEFAEPIDAQRLRADTAERERNEAMNAPNNVFKQMCDLAIEQRNEANAKLAAAEQRIAELVAQGQQLKRLLRDAKANLNPTGRLAKAIDAALNPKPEA